MATDIQGAGRLHGFVPASFECFIYGFNRRHYYGRNFRIMKPGRPKRGESVPSAKVRTWLEPGCLEHVQRRGGSPYVRQLILADLPTRKEPVDEQATRPGKSRFEVVIPAELKAQIMAAGGSAYVRYLVMQACQPDECCDCCGFYSPRECVESTGAKCVLCCKNEVLRE